MKKVGIVLIKNQNKNYPAGDFRSTECIELLKEADIVVTNPPFSLIREFISQLVGYNKKFLILSNSNAIGYKEIFPLFKENKIWLGAATQTKSPRKKARIHSVWFRVPDSYELKNSPCCKIDENGKKYILMISACWFTNLKANYKVKNLDLSKKHYTPEKYPKYDNYDAINVDKVADIPCDYPGVMGVPLTFMDKYCPEQFEIVGISSGRKEFSREAWPTVTYTNPIQHNTDGSVESGSKVNTGPEIITHDVSKIYYTADNTPNKLKRIYTRILIKNKHPENSEQNAGLKPA